MPAKVGFFQKIKLNERTGCWEWTGARNSLGYGRIRFRGKQDMTHRVAAALYLKFNLNSELQVLHHCDNPPCFNPRHLYVGTPKNNMQDRLKRGHNPEALKIHCAKGHPLCGENLLLRPNGNRRCRQCCRDFCAASYRKRVRCICKQS